MGKHTTSTAGDRWRLAQLRSDLAAGWRRLDCESILPSQLDDTPPDNSAKKLARALLDDAASVLRASRFKRRTGMGFYESEDDYWETVEWMFEEPDNGRPCSLSWVCEAMGLDFDATRRAAETVGLKPTRPRRKRYGARIYIVSDLSVEKYRKKRPESRSEYWQRRGG